MPRAAAQATPAGACPAVPNCGAVALAAATGVDLAGWMAHFQSTRSPQWRGRLCWGDLREAAIYFGFRWAEVPDARGTLATFIDQRTSRDAGYIIRVGGHFVFVRGGHVVDQFQAGEIRRHWARRKRVNLAAIVWRKCGDRIKATAPLNIRC